MKFGVFTDLHYDTIPDGDARLQALIDRFLRERVDFAIELGDLCHPTDANRAMLKRFQGAQLPCYFSIGNHNTDHDPAETAQAFFGLTSGHYSVMRENIKFVFLDANYIRTPQGILPYRKADSKLDGADYPYLPPNQIEWLRQEIADDGPHYVICSHQSLANEFAVGHHSRGIANRADVRAVLEARKDRVLLCLNGHDHGSDYKVIGGIPYYALNAASYIWHGVKGVLAYDQATHARYPYLDRMILYEAPPSIIVTVGGDMSVTIEGMQTDYQRVKPSDVGIGDTWNGVSILPEAPSVRVRKS